MDSDTIKKCVLMQHGLAIRNQRLGTCCYNMQPPQSSADYAIDNIGCRSCLDQENNKIFSYRQGANEKYGFEHASKSILVLDVIPNINCNLSCSICDEKSSSTWIKLKNLDFDIRSNLDFDQFAKLARSYDLSALKEINFSGGEPWLNHNICRYIETLQDVIDFSKITLRFSTNGTHQMTERMARFFEKFQLVLARFSVDDIERYHEYQRHPSRWKDFEHNWKHMLENMPNNTIPVINRTVSLLNIHRLSALQAWHDQYRYTKSLDTIELVDHFAFGPYSLDNMCQRHADHVRQCQGENSLAWQYVKNRSFVSANVLGSIIMTQDRIRGTDLRQIDPELFSIIFS